MKINYRYVWFNWCYLAFFAYFSILLHISDKKCTQCDFRNRNICNLFSDIYIINMGIEFVDMCKGSQISENKSRYLLIVLSEMVIDVFNWNVNIWNSHCSILFYFICICIIIFISYLYRWWWVTIFILFIFIFCENRTAHIYASGIVMGSEVTFFQTPHFRRYDSAAAPYVVRSTIGLLSDSFTLVVSYWCAIDMLEYFCVLFFSIYRVTR